MVYITRIEKFNAAHKLWVKHWSEEKNIQFFGKCANKNWHGHNYTLHVTLKGIPDPETGFIHDVKKLSLLIQEYVLEKVDHKNLNLDVDFIPENMMPTTENLAVLFWEELSDKLSGCKLHCIKLYETDKIYSEYYGEAY
jgi:6-pyruvoyltetrahydropterin/6-carboxytetrahydropterin synthase